MYIINENYKPISIKDYEKTKLEKVVVDAGFGDYKGSTLFYIEAGDYLKIEKKYYKDKNGDRQETILNFPPIKVGSLLGVSQDISKGYSNTPQHVHSQIGLGSGLPDPKEYIKYKEVSTEIYEMYKPLQDIYNDFNN